MISFDEAKDKILNKKFNKKIHSGYDPEDVDEFFDDVIKYINSVAEFYNTHLIKEKDSVEKNANIKTLLDIKDEKIRELQAELADLRKEGFHYQALNDKLKDLEKKMAQKK
ncbi:MAG: DivIVA domain-containing protein [Mycoplasmataceae bacterium]|jgi:DivIVA domain-containing protein|nr:DivIVA domain-containing protein [Mycoplasmataceae bacterium]